MSPRLLAVLLLLTACPQQTTPTPDKRAQREAPAPEPARVEAADPRGEAGGGAREEGAPPTMGGVPGIAIDFGEDPRPPAADMVLFAIDGGLVPLACYRAADRSLAGGEACRALVPAGAHVFTVAANSAQVVTADDPKALAPASCARGGQGTLAIEVGGVELFTWGVWPKSGALLTLRLYAEDLAAPADLAPAEIDHLRGLLAARGVKVKGRALTGHQKINLDLDGDDKLEHIWSLTIDRGERSHKKDSSPSHAYSALLVTGPPGDDRLVEVASSRGDDAVYRLLGTADLRGDGRRVVWISRTTGAGVGEQIVELKGDRGEPLAPFTCPPAP